MVLPKKHRVRNVVLLAFLLLVFAEVAVRVAFSLKGYSVGKLEPPWMAINPIDSLVVQQSFFTDEHGIYKARRDFWEPQGYYINSDNFRGREFLTDTLNDSLSILFIGDSFVWGFHAEPLDSSFVDLLDKDAQFTCYNAGIPGTDPAQYAAVAGRYVPPLQPDFTIVGVYLNNDLMDEQRAIVPNQDQWYQTNAGWLPASYKGKHFASAQESFDYVNNKYAPKSFWKRMLLKTAVGTAILALPLRIQEYSEWNNKRESPVTNEYLKQIKVVCDKNNSRLLVLIFPSVATDLTNEFFDDPKSYIQKQYPALMNGLENETLIPPVTKDFYYPPPDAHFNNRGHHAVADFIRTKLNEM